MRVLFSYTGSFQVDSDGRPRSPTMNYALFERYLSVFDELIVAGRYSVSGGPLVSRDTLVTGPGVSFVGLVERKHKLSVTLHHRSIKRQLEQLVSQADAVIARVPSDIASIAIAIARRRGVPVVLEVVGCPFDALTNHGSLLGKVYAPIAAARMRRIVADATHVVYVSQDFLQRRYPTRGKSTNCSNVQLTDYDVQHLERHLTRIGQCAQSGPIRLGLMGSLNVDYKGHGVAIRALKLLVERGLGIELRFAGEGSPDRWQALAQSLGVADRVVFSGLLSRPEVEAWLAKTDVYLQPSKQEGLPRSVVEAMACGCPVVGSRAGGIPELLDEAFLVDADDAAAMAERITALIADPNLAYAQARRNYAEAGKYRFEVLQARREAFFKQWLEETYNG